MPQAKLQTGAVICCTFTKFEPVVKNPFEFYAFLETLRLMPFQKFPDLTTVKVMRVVKLRMYKD
jgi:hypothetical protein